MEHIKQRLALVRSITTGAVSTGHEGFDAELACLQLRKTLELIAFAALTANRARYAEAHSDLTSTWSAKRILERLAQMHPDYYPVPMVFKDEEPGGIKTFAEIADGFLSKDDFIFLYDKCSDVVHSWNPHRRDERRVDFGRSIADWIGRIELLLGLHRIRLIDQPEFLVVYLSYPEDGKAHVLTATPRAV